MPILNIQPNEPGQSGVVPSIQRLKTNDTVAVVTATGYLNDAVKSGMMSVSETDMILVCTSTVQDAEPDQVGWYEVTYSAGNWSLVPPATPGSVVLPTIQNHIAIFTNTTGTIGEDATTAINGGNIQAGLSGTAGYLASFPGTASKGSLHIAAVANTGNTVTTVSNAAMGQATTVSIPDPGTATAKFLLDTGSQLMASGAKLALDKATGTEASNAVTINAQAGVITTSSLTVTAGSTYSITLTNSKIATSSVVLTQWMGGTNTLANFTVSATAGNGSSTIVIHNNDAVTSISGTIILGFSVF